MQFVNGGVFYTIFSHTSLARTIPAYFTSTLYFQDFRAASNNKIVATFQLETSTAIFANFATKKARWLTATYSQTRKIPCKLMQLCFLERRKAICKWRKISFSRWSIHSLHFLAHWMPALHSRNPLARRKRKTCRELMFGTTKVSYFRQRFARWLITAYSRMSFAQS